MINELKKILYSIYYQCPKLYISICDNKDSLSFAIILRGVIDNNIVYQNSFDGSNNKSFNLIKKDLLKIRKKYKGLIFDKTRTC